MKLLSKFLVSLVCLISSRVYAQSNDFASIPFNSDSLSRGLQTNAGIKSIETKKKLKQLYAPAIFIAYGFISLQSDGLKDLDEYIKEEIWDDHPHHKITIDNYLQYTPAIAVYGLNAMGIKGKNNFRDRSMIYLLSNIFMGATVQFIKAATRIPRPDGGGTNAFPSGHTATAFAGAEFLMQEYKDRSPWFGIAGYTIAGTTGYLRMYNNVHWFRDLLPGMGIGLLSTRVAYWIYPTIKRKLFPAKHLHS